MSLIYSTNEIGSRIEPLSWFSKLELCHSQLRTVYYQTRSQRYRRGDMIPIHAVFAMAMLVLLGEGQCMDPCQVRADTIFLQKKSAELIGNK